MSRFNLPVWTAAAALCCTVEGAGCATAERPPGECAGYAVVPADDRVREDLRWADYLCDHLRRRAEGGGRTVGSELGAELFTLTVGVDTLSDDDFRVEREPQGVRITARDGRRMLWLQYQLMKTLAAEDRRIEGADLPPATVGLRDTAGRFAFSYRGLYTPAAHDADLRGILSADDAEQGWGLWGHQLDRVLAGAPEAVFATVSGRRYEGQYCFSAEQTFRRIERYILDRFGEGGSGTAPMRFVIAPADDAAACTCERCAGMGNTDRSATPAVTHLVTRLARRFPHHRFFTLGYLSVREAPAVRMPRNAGVIVSAMELPPVAGADRTPAGRKFAAELERWKAAADEVWVWDYIQNFDDYLTPFPVLELTAERLRFYRAEGVGGVFLNGSGVDYVPFDDMRSWVLAALLADPLQSPEALMRRFFAEKYPRAGTLLADYCAATERRAAASKRPLDLYGGIRAAEATWLDAAEFARFYDELADRLPSTRDAERRSLHRLLTALSFTRLEIARSHAAGACGLARRTDDGRLEAKADVGRWLAALAEHADFPEMNYTDEAHRTIADYLAEWRSRILPGLGQRNLLLGGRLTPLSEPDEQYTDLSVLTDGVRGMAFGYHCGWHISSADLEVALPVSAAARKGRLGVSFLSLPRHRLHAPRAVELYRDGVLHATLQPRPGADPRIVEFSAAVDLSGASRITLRALRAEGERTQLAAGEIYFNP